MRIFGDCLSGARTKICHYSEERLIYKKKAPYKFWLPYCNIPKPSRLPKSLELYHRVDMMWTKCSTHTKYWEVDIYRWREDVPMEGDE